MKKLFFISVFISLFAFQPCSGQELIDSTYRIEIENFRSQLNHHYQDEKKSPLSEADRLNFVRHEFYGLNPDYRVVARLDKVAQNKIIKFKTSTTREPEYLIYAKAIFIIEGKEMGLNIYRNAKALAKNPEDNMAFLPFNDLTNGVETYGGGRYLDIDLDLDSETVVIDFNKSYNPYCAYSDLYSCPVPPRENNLNVMIEAGIKLTSDHHEQEAVKMTSNKSLKLTLEQANKLIELPLACIQKEYPNRLGQTLGDSSDIGEPKELHPAFYGCFDWHSAVHGHWSLVKLLKEFPGLDKAGMVKIKLKQNLSAQNITKELAYFQHKHNTSYERTYGWAWLLKLSEELHTWDDPLAQELERNLSPLVDLIVNKYIEFLPKLLYPIRAGEHTNTAFGLCFAWDYAVATGHDKLKQSIEDRAIDYFMSDSDCPLIWEPSGYDFLSPCFEEIDLMRRVLEKDTFLVWFEKFTPTMINSRYKLKAAKVSDRTDGKLVHLDGLNFSRAWVLYGLANQYRQFDYLVNIANAHIDYSLANLVDDAYEGGHWLGSFALYAMTR